MLVVAAGLLALASAAPRECNTSGPRVQCKGHGLSAMPTTLDRKTTHLDLRQNDIRHLVLPATARHLRTRRDIEFTCEDGTAVSIQTAVDDGNGLEYGYVTTFATFGGDNAKRGICSRKPARPSPINPNSPPHMALKARIDGFAGCRLVQHKLNEHDDTDGRWGVAALSVPCTKKTRNNWGMHAVKASASVAVLGLGPRCCYQC